MKEIKNLVDGFLNDLTHKKKSLETDKVMAVWRDLVDQDIVKHTKIVCLTKNKITINVDSSAWLYHLHLQKKSLLKKIKKNTSIEDVYFQLGDV